MSAPSYPRLDDLPVEVLNGDRFEFLFPPGKNTLPRFLLSAPDCFGPESWSVFDRAERRTIARGKTPAEAVDRAMLYFTRESLHALQPNQAGQ